MEHANNFKDITGQRYGYLTAIRPVGVIVVKKLKSVELLLNDINKLALLSHAVVNLLLKN